VNPVICLPACKSHAIFPPPSSPAVTNIPIGSVLAVISYTASGVTITATFDSTIMNAPNSQAIQNCINAAISVYQPLLTDFINVSILFRYAVPQQSMAAVGQSEFEFTQSHTILLFSC
jgi:hypothetical protein